MFVTWFFLFLDSFFQSNDPHQNDLHWDNSNYLNGFLSYALQANHFFPIDVYFAQAVIYFAIYGLLSGFKIVEIILNVVRGSGVRL